MGDIVKFEPGELCVFCKRRKATRACDFPVGRAHYVGHPPKIGGIIPPGVPMSYTMTCNRLMCDKCAMNIAHEIDFCPRCAARLREMLGKRRTEDG